MVSFKQFLTEAAVKKWKVSPLEVKKAIDFLNTNCKDGLAAISNGGIIFRGFGDSITKTGKSFAQVDATDAVRTSRDTNNVYQLMMDSSPAMADTPKRSKSFICSTSFVASSEYGATYVMVPYDGTQVAVAAVSDIFKQQIRSSIYSGDPENISGDWGAFFVAIGARKNGRGQFVSAADLNAVMAKYTPEELVVFLDILGIQDDDTFSIPFYEIKGATDKMSYEGIGRPFGYRASAVQHVRQFAKYLEDEKNRKLLTSAQRKMHALFAANTDRRFDALSNIIMTPASTSISVVPYGSALPNNAEVWFEGRAIAITIEVFGQILYQLQKQNFSIHRSVVNQMSGFMYEGDEEDEIKF